MTTQDRIKNAFLCQAIADGMGEGFEFQDPTLQEVRGFINSSAPIHITDDTQMTLFGQEAVNSFTGLDDVDLIRSAYVRWFLTQHKTNSPSGLGVRPEMLVRRAPGNQCLAALGAITGGRQAHTSDGAGCGGVMRLLPFTALYLTRGEEVAREMAQQSSAITHSHPRAIQAVNDLMDVAIFLMQGGNRFELNMQAKDISDLGQGWVADECVWMATWAVSKALNYDHLLELAITHKGDSDSVAAVAGALWGLAGLSGYERHLSRLVEVDAVLSVIAQ